MEKDSGQLNLFQEQNNKLLKPKAPKDAKVVSMEDYKELKERERIYEWVLKNIPSY